MTFTILVRDARSGLIGGATASRSLAAGNAVLAVRPGVGVVASQAWTNRHLRVLALDALQGGADAAAVVGRIPGWDDDSRLRQVAVLPVDGPAAAHSGADITPWSGHRIAAGAVAAGNLLTGGDVLDAMIDALADPLDVDGAAADAPAAFAARLVAILRAGEDRGGDARGRQSAAVQVADGSDIRVDLRVDDHADPLPELGRLIDLRAGDLRAAGRDSAVSARTV